MPDTTSHVFIKTSTINIRMPLADLVEARPGYLVHPTEKAGPEQKAIVVRKRDFAVLDPDEAGRFRIGNKLLTFEEIVGDQADQADEEE